MISGPEPLTAEHNLTAFACGKPALDTWLKTHALANQENRFTVVMVVHTEGRVVGYYGLAPTAVERRLVPRAVRTGQSPDPVPCLLLGQLAVDREWSGKGVGSALFKDAMTRCIEAARLIGGRAVVVNAVDADAAGYWKRRGFAPSRDDPLVLLQSIARIAASLAQAAAE